MPITLENLNQDLAVLKLREQNYAEEYHQIKGGIAYLEKMIAFLHHEADSIDSNAKEEEKILNAE